jgi:hypothetical protein
MAYVAKRRRGQNKPKAAINLTSNVSGPTIEAPPEPPSPTKRRKRADVNGMHLRLAAPTRPGYQRRWFNDTPGRLATAEELAYEHVQESGIKSDSPDSRVRRLVGTQAGGAPLYAYLMETPREEYQRGIEEKEEQHRAVDAAIQRGEDPTGRVQDSYGEGSIGTR